MNLKSIWNVFAPAIERVGRSRARRELLALGDHTLDDAGISRELLESGVGAWPWREPAEDHARWRFDALTATSSGLGEVEYVQAARELRAYTDAELNDLGVHRGRIDEAVRHGRPGIDEEPRRAA